MTKDKKARTLGFLTLSALGVTLASIVDAMKFADVPNDVAHHFLDRLEDGFFEVLHGEAQDMMLMMVGVLRGSVADND